MLRVISIVIIGLLFSCSKNEASDKEEIKNFFLNISDQDLPKEVPFVLIDRFDSKEWRNDFKQWASIDSILTFKEINFVAAKIETSTSVIWTNDVIKNAKIVAKNYLDTVTQPEPLMVRPSLYTLSRPYFTENKKYCVMYFSVYCGLLCAEKSIKIYKKENSKWMLIRNYSISMS